MKYRCCNKKMRCKKCKEEKGQVRSGKTKAESQIYKCKKFGKYYIPNMKKRRYSEKKIKEAMKLYI